MAKTISKSRTTRVSQNKNGTTSTFTKSKSISGKTKWTKTGGSSGTKKKR